MFFKKPPAPRSCWHEQQPASRPGLRNNGPGPAGSCVSQRRTVHAEQTQHGCNATSVHGMSTPRRSSGVGRAAARSCVSHLSPIHVHARMPPRRARRGGCMHARRSEQPQQLRRATGADTLHCSARHAVDCPDAVTRAHKVCLVCVRASDGSDRGPRIRLPSDQRYPAGACARHVDCANTCCRLIINVNLIKVMFGRSA